MAINVTFLSAVVNTSNQNTYPLEGTPSTSTSLLLFMPSVAGCAITGSVSDSQSYTWTNRAVVTSGGDVITAWTAQASTTAATTVTIDVTGDTGAGIAAALYEVTGTSVEFLQVATNTATSQTASVTFGSALNTNNAYILGLHRDQASNNLGDGPTGWVEDLDQGHVTPNHGMYAAHRVNGETGTTYEVSQSSSNTWAIIAMEFREAPAATGWGLLLGRDRNRLVRAG